MREGELFGFLGPNGAGKSTTMNILAKDFRAYYLKPPNISWDIIFPLAWAGMFFIRSGINWATLIPAIVLIAISSTFMGLFIAVSVSEVFDAQTFSNFFRFPMLFLCGLFFPVAHFPAWLRPLSYALPLTYGADVLHGSIHRAPHLPLALNLGAFDDLEQIRSVVIARHDGNRLYLQDIAQVVDSHVDQRIITRVNGDPCVNLSVFKAAEANDETRRVFAKHLLARRPGDRSLPTFQHSASLRELVSSFIFEAAVFYQDVFSDLIKQHDSLTFQR